MQEIFQEEQDHMGHHKITVFFYHFVASLEDVQAVIQTYPLR